MATVEGSSAAARTGRGELRGRGSAVLILSCFTFVWVAWGMPEASTAAVLAVVCTTVVLCLGTIAGGVRLLRAAARRPAESAGPEVFRRYWLIVVAEFVGIGLAATLLGSTGNAEWIPAVVCLGVGIHFGPLAVLFRLRLYHLTAAFMTVVAVTTMVVVPLAAVPPVMWRVLPCFGAAVALWVTCVALLATTRLGTARTVAA